MERKQMILIGVGIGLLVLLGLLWWWRRCSPDDDDTISLKLSAAQLVNDGQAYVVPFTINDSNTTLPECVVEVDDKTHHVIARKDGTYTFTLSFNQEAPGTRGTTYIDSYINKVHTHTYTVPNTPTFSLVTSYDLKEDGELYWMFHNIDNTSGQPAKFTLSKAEGTFKESDTNNNG